MHTNGHQSRAALPVAGAFLLVLTTALLAGCSLPIEPAKADAARYYVLGSDEAAVPATVRPLVIALQKVTVAGFLEPKGMAVAVGGSEVRYDEYARWAEPLRDAIARRLQQRIGAKATVLAAPVRPAAKRDFDLVVNVTQCGGAAGGIRFAARFELQQADGTVVQREFTAGPAEWNGRDFGALADRLGAAVNELAGAILAAAGAGE